MSTTAEVPSGLAPPAGSRFGRVLAPFRRRRGGKGAGHSGGGGRFGLVLALLTLPMIAVFLLPLSVIFIGPGRGGVMWHRFGGGTVFGPPLGEGYHIIWPWDRIYIYNLRLQNLHESMIALTGDAVRLSINVNLRYRLSPRNLAYLHVAVGPDYVAKVIEPQVAAVVRELVALYPMESLLGPLRNQVQRAIFLAITDHSGLNSMGAIDTSTGADAQDLGSRVTLQPRRTASVSGYVNMSVNTLNRPLILLQDLLISRIIMPASVEAAVEAKMQQAQRAQQYNYRLTAEHLEAERKVVEADGIRRFQDIVNRGMTPAYLTYLGVVATEALARSPNSKVIVIGGANGLPLILNPGAEATLPGGTPVRPPSSQPATAPPGPEMPDNPTGAGPTTPLTPEVPDNATGAGPP